MTSSSQALGESEQAMCTDEDAARRLHLEMNGFAQRRRGATGDLARYARAGLGKPSPSTDVEMSEAEPKTQGRRLQQYCIKTCCRIWPTGMVSLQEILRTVCLKLPKIKELWTVNLHLWMLDSDNLNLQKSSSKYPRTTAVSQRQQH